MKLLTRDAFPNQYKQPKKLNIGKKKKKTEKQRRHRLAKKHLKRYSAALITKKCKSKLL